MKTANEEIFLPRGLRCKVLKTPKMMAAVGHGGTTLELPPLDRLGERDEWDEEKDDPRMRRMRALGDSVAPLTFEGLPAPEAPENWWKRMGSKEAQKKDAKMNEKLAKERRKGLEKYEKKMEKAQKKAVKYDREIGKVERDRMKEVAKAERELSGKKGQDPKERVKIEEDLQRELRKLDEEQNQALMDKEEKMEKKMRKGETRFEKTDEKEHKVAQKIY